MPYKCCWVFLYFVRSRNLGSGVEGALTRLLNAGVAMRCAAYVGLMRYAMRFSLLYGGKALFAFNPSSSLYFA